MTRKYDVIVPAVNRIIAEYAGMRLTLRQIYYRLVAAQVIPNTVSQYKGLSSLLVKARMDGDVRFGAIEDRTRAAHEGFLMDIPFSLRLRRSATENSLTASRVFREYWDFVENLADHYDMPMQWRQPKHIQVWVEKQALLPLFAQVTDRRNVDLQVCRGYPSLTFLHDAAGGLNALNDDGYGWEDLVVLYFGDYDPSGKDIERYCEERLGDLGASPEVRHIAITREQIDEFEIPPAPAKTTDSRYWEFVATEGVAWQVELDAIEPRALQGIVRDAVMEHWDEAAGERREEELERRRDRIRGWVIDALDPDFAPPAVDEDDDTDKSPEAEE